jgi:hypothetical protein
MLLLLSTNDMFYQHREVIRYKPMCEIEKDDKKHLLTYLNPCTARGS